MIPSLLMAMCLTCCLMVSGVWTDDSRDEDRRQINSDTPNNTIVVTINPGQQLKGFYRALVTGTVIYKFWGIKFGQAPVGDRRFAEPEAEPDWQGERDALESGKKCWQSPEANPEESEDCLYLNVYTPDVTGSVPVMVWIHGGAYTSGSGSEFMYDGSTLAARGVVVVTINYRLGAYGFLSTGDDVMPGNYGLLDQVLALKWVQKNIHAFGGDPGTVTIFGESAGASSVALQILSPLSKDLFHRAIMQSGSALSVWAVERPATEVGVDDYTREVGSRIGCVDQDSATFLACLRKVDAQVLYNASYTLRNDIDIDIVANPRVETTFGFLPDYPQDLLDNGLFNKVDTLRGFNSGEWAFVIEDLDEDGLTREEFGENFANVFTSYSLDNTSREYLINLVENIYLGNETNPIEIRSLLIDALTDTLFAAAELLELEKFISHGADGQQHYVYELDYKVKSRLNLQSIGPDWWRTIHSGDLPFVFTDDQVGIVAYLTPPDDLAVGEKVQTWWTNFAKFGNPTATKVVEDGVEVEWDPYSIANPDLLKISLKSSLNPYPKQSFLQIYNYVLDFLRRDQVRRGA